MLLLLCSNLFHLRFIYKGGREGGGRGSQSVQITCGVFVLWTRFSGDLGLGPMYLNDNYRLIAAFHYLFSFLGNPLDHNACPYIHTYSSEYHMYPYSYIHVHICTHVVLLAYAHKCRDRFRQARVKRSSIRI